MKTHLIQTKSNSGMRKRVEDIVCQNCPQKSIVLPPPHPQGYHIGSCITLFFERYHLYIVIKHSPVIVTWCLVIGGLHWPVSTLIQRTCKCNNTWKPVCGLSHTRRKTWWLYVIIFYIVILTVSVADTSCG